MMTHQLITDFWNRRYNFRNQSTTIDAFIYRLNPGVTTNFIRESGKLVDLKKKRPRGSQLKHVYLASPKSPEAIRHHTVPSTNTDFYTANINGLLSKSKGNKCELLRKFISTGNTHKVIALTETWLTPDHFNAEFIKPFHNYCVFRADRDTNFNPDDDAQLNSRGGVAILISPEITAIPVMSFSNGNCEIVAIECPELSIIIANIYRPPGVNLFSTEIRSDSK